jgi:glycosyltransferase involved in cell wall biosynthesis
MRLMFVYSLPRNRGYAHDVRAYMRVAETLGHEVALYGRTHPRSTVKRSTDIESADGVLLIMETFYKLQHDNEALHQLMTKVPRRRRVIIDCDGMYNDVISVDGDYNHADEDASRERVELCDRLSDKIYQNTFHPQRSNVGTFLFAAYDSHGEIPLDFGAKEYGMRYIGNNWFRWGPMKRILTAIEPIRERVGRIGIVGDGWDRIAETVDPPLRDAACFTDPAYLEALGVELMGSVHVDQVTSCMSSAHFNPVLIRPLYDHLKIVTPHAFETFAANTVPLLMLEKEYARELYGERADELVLAGEPAEQILDVLDRPQYYAQLVEAIRQRLAERHSYAARLEQLIEIIET